MKLDKYDLAMVNATSKENSRPVLQTLHLTKGRIEVASGALLALRDLELSENEAPPEALLPVKAVKQIKTTQAQRTLLIVEEDIAKIIYQTRQGGTIEFEPTFSFKTFKQGTFPDIASLIQKVPTVKRVQTAISVNLLKKLVSILPDDGILRIGITEPEKEIEFSCEIMDRPIRGLIMPMYVAWGKFSWWRPETKKEETHVKPNGTNPG